MSDNEQTTPPGAPRGGSWKPVTDLALGSGRLDLDPEAIKRCITLCGDHADAMGRLAERARYELDVDALGIGEAYLESARQLTQKFKDKAVGGGQIEDWNSAVGLFRSHESHARDMKSTFEAVLKAYEEQEGITTAALTAQGDDLA
ncbi:MAG: hypothetical protein GX542_02160 [Rhodococcus sp.]|nr:hypothetical protein [Rhodococcus sp. (in: high G+C Gram-positive bacteria)]